MSTIRLYEVRSAEPSGLVLPDPAAVLGCETRSTFGTLEVRADGDADERGDFWGPALPWNTLDSYGTRFAPDAFRDGGVDSEPYALLWMHDPWTVAGTLWAEPRDDALWIAKGIYDDTPDGSAARARGKSGSARGLSVGFERIGDEQLEDGSVLITKARLVEISQITSRMESVPGAGLAGVRAARRPEARQAPETDEAAEAARLRALARLRLS